MVARIKLAVWLIFSEVRVDTCTRTLCVLGDTAAIDHTYVAVCEPWLACAAAGTPRRRSTGDLRERRSEPQNSRGPYRSCGASHLTTAALSDRQLSANSCPPLSCASVAPTPDPGSARPHTWQRGNVCPKLQALTQRLQVAAS